MTIKLTGFALFSALIIIPGTATAQDAEPERLIMLGAGVYIGSNPYESAKDDTQAGVLPLFLYQQGRVRLDLSGVTLRAYSSGPFTVEGRLSPRIPLTEPKDTLDFSYLERDVGVDAGVRLSAQRGGLLASVEYLADISDQSQGQSVDLAMSWAFEPTPRLGLELSAGVVWSDADLSTWLYGIRQDEALGGPVYQYGDTLGASSNGVWTPHLGVQARYQLTQRTLLIGGVNADIYSNDVTDSPLISEDASAGVFLGVMRRF